MNKLQFLYQLRLFCFGQDPSMLYDCFFFDLLASSVFSFFSLLIHRNGMDVTFQIALSVPFFNDITSINPSFNKRVYLSLKFFKLLRFLSGKSITNNALDFCNLSLIRSILTNTLKFFNSIKPEGGEWSFLPAANLNLIFF